MNKERPTSFDVGLSVVEINSFFNKFFLELPLTNLGLKKNDAT
jgi:hypothetical protein